MNIETKCVYCSCACNKSPNTVDWGLNNYVCYAACNAIHLYTFQENGNPLYFQTLTWHKKLVTSVHWIRQENAIENELIATSADHCASIWTLNDSMFQLSSSLVGHTSIVRNASAIYLDSYMKLMVVTLSADSSIKIWFRDRESEAICIQTISLGNGFGIDAKFATLSNTNEMLLLVGADDSKIHIYSKNGENIFTEVICLKGHKDWIQNIDVIRENEKSIMITSASQDCHIRIWKISNTEVSHHITDSDELKVDAITFTLQSSNSYSITLESVLSGHDNWIYSARWRKHKSNSGNITLQILSASMDKTILLWEFDSNSNMWIEKARLGEVGGNTLGFYGAIFSNEGDYIIAHGYQGAIHTWKLNKNEDIWQPGLSFGGHFSSVQDLDWDPNGEFLLSCSADQTTRLHAPYIQDEETNWYEIARPQVHGYDMVCLSILNRFKYISAGDEKVLRVFEAPRSFAETLKNLSKLEVHSYIKDKMAEGASVPSLGLSNKAVFEEDINISNDSLQNQDSKKSFKDQYPDFYYTPVQLTEPPTEEVLLQNTLWPEIQKLYGHPYEVFTVTSNHSKTLVASACKASKIEHAGIILWCTSTWKQISYLPFHTLTVTQIEFSPNDEYLLSVSRDRMWVLYKHFPEESSLYRKVANLDRKLGVHARIIWSCAWTFDSLYFSTASRDKKVAMWGKYSEEGQIVQEQHTLCSKPLEVEDSATAISIAPKLIQNKYIIAIGLENGCILLSSFCKELGWSILQKLDQNIAHHLNVNRLRFSPVLGEAGNKEKNSEILQLASCGSDHHIKIYSLYIK